MGELRLQAEGGFFAQEPLSFNWRQRRLHQVSPGDHVWPVSRDPDNRQYYIVGVLRVTERRTNEPGGELATAYGEYGVVAHRVGSYDLARRFPAEGLLRSLSYGSPSRVVLCCPFRASACVAS